jgi:hypothetical protein
VIGTYAAVLAVCLAAPAIGQAAIALCGVRRWSWLAPAVGLALLCAVCWGTVRLPGNGIVPAILAPALALAAAVYLRGRVEGGGEALRAGWPVALLALAATALPFVAEGHFGILGTSFNPDMSQHLLAADRLAHGGGSQLLHQGYPLGPHAIVVALSKGLGIGLVEAFTGLTIAIAVLASLTALTVFADQPPLLRIPAALVVGLTYMAASYFAQGAFKETMQALFFLAFVLALRETSVNPAWRSLPLRFVPAALLAVGSVYVYSFPGLIWLLGAAAIWALAQLVVTRCFPSAVVRPVLMASLLFAVLIAPELGRMIDFHSFETFDPNGPGLGNLFGQISPFEALGIWPSGDFRLDPGNGAVPSLGYYAGAVFAAILLVYGAVCCWLRRETALLAGLASAGAAYAVARVAGTPYTAAKAIEVGAPLAAVTIVMPLLRRPVTWLYMLAALGCASLALANAPVGPRSYSSALVVFRAKVDGAPTLLLAPPRLLEREHGLPYLTWEMRGGRVCIEPEGSAARRDARRVRFVVSGSPRPPFAGLRRVEAAGPYFLWRRAGRLVGPRACPYIGVRQGRQGAPR